MDNRVAAYALGWCAQCGARNDSISCSACGGRLEPLRTKPFNSVLPPKQPPICAVTVSSSWHEPVACAFPPDHDGPHSWASIPALPRHGRMTKREAGVRLAIISGEILLTLDEDEDAPSWPAELITIADALNPGGAT